MNTLFNENSQLDALTKSAKSHQLLQQFWHAAAPKPLAQLSLVGSLTNGQLAVYADSAIVANKLKLTQASLLTQLQNLQQTQPLFRECKVTAIAIKVQVKSHPKPTVHKPRKLTDHAAKTLKAFTQELGDSPLASRLNSLVNKR